MTYLLEFFGVLLILAVIGIPMSIWSGRKRKKKIEEVFSGRQELNAEDFYEKYFKSQGIPFFVVQKVREILERELDADLSKLSSEDDFSKNLSFFWEYDSLADEEIIMSLEEEFQIEFNRDEVWEDFRSVNQIMNLVWRKVSVKDTNDS